MNNATASSAPWGIEGPSHEYVSVTFGAGGSTLSYTVGRCATQTRACLEAAPHLSCMGGTREEIRALLDEYRALGLCRIVACAATCPRAWPASATSATPATWSPSSAAKRAGTSTSVACYPEVHPQAEDAHADPPISTQDRSRGEWRDHPVFLQCRWLLRFVEAVRRSGVDVPVVPASCQSEISASQRFSTCAVPRSRAGSAAACRVRRRCRIDPRVQRRRGRRPLPQAGRRRRAGPALLHAQPRAADPGDPRTPVAVHRRRGRAGRRVTP